MKWYESKTLPQIMGTIIATTTKISIVLVIAAGTYILVSGVYKAVDDTAKRIEWKNDTVRQLRCVTATGAPLYTSPWADDITSQPQGGAAVWRISGTGNYTQPTNTVCKLVWTWKKK